MRRSYLLYPCQHAQRQGKNAKLIFKWRRNPRYVPEAGLEPDAAPFLPVEIVDCAAHDDSRTTTDAIPATGETPPEQLRFAALTTPVSTGPFDRADDHR
ncbi:MAG: hypothetical protein FJX25_11535 [Alphaproteobacteria bacterium]|nr:hypothetical protein [Alphaproteobacteria bacterium]